MAIGRQHQPNIEAQSFERYREGIRDITEPAGFYQRVSFARGKQYLYLLHSLGLEIASISKHRMKMNESTSALFVRIV
jgi:hypothetical protein